MSQYVRKILARNLKKLRIANNLNCKTLSISLGFDVSYVSKIETCKMNVTIDSLAKIAKFFEVEISELFKN